MKPHTKKYTIPQRLRYVMSILFDNEPPDMPVHRGSGDIDGESVLHNQWEEDVNKVESIRDEYRFRPLSDRSLRLTEVEELNRIYKKWNKLQSFYNDNPDLAWCKTDVYQAWCNRPNPKESDSRLTFFANFYGIELKVNGQ